MRPRFVPLPSASPPQPGGICPRHWQRFTAPRGRVQPLSWPLRTKPQLSRDRMHALVVGAGFECINIRSARERLTRTITARRLRSLPDLIAPGLRLLICGLNPSLYSADAGVPFARPGNRFWPAALHAELIVRCRNPVDALRRGIGFTDLVKRATTAAAELRADEYVAGAARVAALISLYRPTATCFVGLEGWRRAGDRGAQPGWIRGGFGGRPRLPDAFNFGPKRTHADARPCPISRARSRPPRYWSCTPPRFPGTIASRG